MIKVTSQKIVKVDMTGDDVASYGGDYVHVKGPELVLVIGNLQILLTEEQEEQIRQYYQNT